MGLPLVDAKLAAERMAALAATAEFEAGRKERLRKAALAAWGYTLPPIGSHLTGPYAHGITGGVLAGCTASELPTENQNVSKTTDWNLITKALECDEVNTAYLWGPPGIGKTYAAYHTGRISKGVFAVTLTEETPAAELRGHWIPKGGGMEWMDGPCVEAMRIGARLVINEVTHASADAWSFMLPILEGHGTARLTLPNCETVTPADGFHVICTDNCEPQALPPALKDRFDVQIHVTEPAPEALALLPVGWRDMAKSMCAVAEDRRVSMRSWLAVQKLEPKVGLDMAMRMVFGEQRSVQISEAVRLAAANKAGKPTAPKSMAEALAELSILAEKAGVETYKLTVR